MLPEGKYGGDRKVSWDLAIRENLGDHGKSSAAVRVESVGGDQVERVSKFGKVKKGWDRVRGEHGGKAEALIFFNEIGLSRNLERGRD